MSGSKTPEDTHIYGKRRLGSWSTFIFAQDTMGFWVEIDHPGAVEQMAISYDRQSQQTGKSNFVFGGGSSSGSRFWSK